MGITRSEIEARIAELKRALSSPDSGEPKVPAYQPPILTKSQIAERISSLKREIEPQKPQEGFMHRAGQFGRGIAKGLGSTLDILGEIGREANEVAKIPSLRGIEEEQGIQPRQYPEYATAIPEAIGFSEEYVPQKGDTLGNVLETTGEFLSPIPIPGIGYANVGRKFATEGLKGAAKELGKEAAMSASGAAAIKATPRISEEGTPAGAMEDFAKGLFGIKAADKIVQKNLTKTIARIPKNIGLSATTAMAKPNERTFELSKKHDITLPFNVGMRSRPMNFVANNYLKSMFTSSVYEDALKNSNESMVNAVKRNIDELGPSTLRPSEASGEYRRFIEAEEKSAEEASSALYDEASKFLKKTDIVKPINTAKFIGNMEELLSRDIQSPATKKVANIVGNLAESWGISPPGKTLKDLEDNPKLIEAYLKQFKSKLPSIHVEKLIGVRKELGTITKFDPTAKGSEAYLEGLRKVIDKDIENIHKKEFLSKWRNANSEFKRNVADRFRGDIARSLLAHEMPTEAYSLLNSPENVKELSKIAGQNPKSKEIFDALKKAKVRDMFSMALQDESLRTSPFINIFNRKEKTAELLESLVGKEQFKKLSEISEIAEEFKYANQELLNTSRSAVTHSDFMRLQKLPKEVLSLIFNVGTGYGLGHSLGAAAGAAASVAMPNLISRLVANPRFINEARAYAIARKNNRQVHADTILRRLIKLTDAEQRLMVKELQSKKSEKE